MNSIVKLQKISMYKHRRAHDDILYQKLLEIDLRWRSQAIRSLSAFLVYVRRACKKERRSIQGTRKINLFRKLIRSPHVITVEQRYPLSLSQFHTALSCFRNTKVCRIVN